MEPPPVQYVRTSDGYDIAYAVSGDGPPLVVLPEQMSHIQNVWTWDTYMRPWLQGLAEHYRLIQHDGRGQGMSSRGLPEGHSLADEVRDLETVVDHLQLDNFVLLSRTHVGVLYALAHPRRVMALVLQSVPAAGGTYSILGEELAQGNWEVFLRTLLLLTGLPDARRSEEQLQQAVNGAKQLVTQGDWITRRRARVASDIADLAPRLQTPTLMLHARDSWFMSVEQSMKLAALIPGSRMVVIDGINGFGDATQGLKAIADFLGSLPAGAPEADPAPASFSHGLSPREIEVLRLVAAGRSNQQIADELVISVRTAERHIANIYLKTETHGRAQITAYALQHGPT